MKSQAALALLIRRALVGAERADMEKTLEAIIRIANLLQLTDLEAEAWKTLSAMNESDRLQLTFEEYVTNIREEGAR